MITFYLTIFFRKVYIVHEHPYEKILNIEQHYNDNEILFI